MRRQGTAGNREQGTAGGGMRARRWGLVARVVVGAGALAATLSLSGCRQDMQNEPKFYPQRGSEFYPDGRSVRPQVENTVARNQLRADTYYHTGFIGDGKEGDGMPFPVTLAVLQRGQERYNIYCTPCHSRVGNGAGMIVQRGYAAAGNLNTARLQTMPLGHFFNVISNGYGAMPDYTAQLPVEDRWAVTAYVRALQLSQKATAADVAAGAHVEPLADIAEREGFPRGFGDDWTLPPTAVKGTPSGDDYPIPTGTSNAPNGGPPAASPQQIPPRPGPPTAGANYANGKQ